MKTLTREEQITEFLSNLDTEIKITNHLTDYDIEELKNLQDAQAEWLFEHLEGLGAFNIDIIYYDKAMAYLLENDPSLTESLSLAEEMGYTAVNLSSETLASLLANRKATESFWEVQEEIETFFKELNEN